MKKFLFLVVAIAALGACNDDLTESAAPGFRFEQPEVSSIKSTAVVVSCRAPRGGALLEALESGFVCTPGSGGAGDSFVTTDCEVSGDLLSARLTGRAARAYVSGLCLSRNKPERAHYGPRGRVCDRSVG